MAKHKHHIVPKYEGGSDDPSNLVDLSVTQHAMWHFAEWQRKGRKEDKIAWQGLAKIIGKEEAIKQAAGLGGAKSKGRTVSKETRQKISESQIGKNQRQKRTETSGSKRKNCGNKKRKTVVCKSKR